MASITVYFNDDSKKHFPETSRAGGSWSTGYEVIGEWIRITDAYGNETLIHSDRIKEVKVDNPPLW